MVENIISEKLKTISKPRKEPSKSIVGKTRQVIDKVEHTTGKIQGQNGKSNSSHDMLSWQFKTLLGQIQQIELHESGDCPCILNTQDPPERCLGKHLLNISTLSRETANMSSQNKDWLLKLAKEANERHEQFKRFICHTEDLPKLTDWARNWRKQFIEPNYYSCEVQPLEETALQDASLKNGKLAGGLNAVTSKSTMDQKTPAGSCTRVDLKN